MIEHGGAWDVKDGVITAHDMSQWRAGIEEATRLDVALDPDSKSVQEVVVEART